MACLTTRCSGQAVIVAAPCSPKDGVLAGAEWASCLPLSEIVSWHEHCVKKPPRAESNTSHLAGEYFVAAELYRRGYSVAMTIGNAKAIDLFAEKGRCTVNVQVKAIRVRQNVGWPMTKSKVWSNVLYVFVCLNENQTPPTYFVATASEVRPRVKQYKTRGILNYGQLNSAQFLGRWDKVDEALRKAKRRLPGHGSPDVG